MNIVLFESEEIGRPLQRGDARAKHILGVLRCGLGDRFDVGVIDGLMGKAMVSGFGEDTLSLTFEWGEEGPGLSPIDLVVGLSRPQTNRKILQEATALGVRSMRFVTTDRGEPSYAGSKLWSTGEWRRHVVDGVGQAFSTKMPQVAFGMSLGEAIGELGDAGAVRLGMDNYEAEVRLGAVDFLGASSVALALGSERGWSGAERDLLRERGFRLAGLGERVLRTETAVVSAVAVVREGLADR